MGKGDRRNSLKMHRRKRLVSKKARALRKRAAAVKAREAEGRSAKSD